MSVAPVYERLKFTGCVLAARIRTMVRSSISAAEIV